MSGLAPLGVPLHEVNVSIFAAKLKEGFLQLNYETRNRVRHNISEQLIKILSTYTAFCTARAQHQQTEQPNLIQVKPNVIEELFGGIPNLTVILKNIRCLLVHCETNLRNQALRLLRYMLLDREVVVKLNTLNIDLFIGRSLEADPKLPWERMNAFKVLKAIMKLDPSLVTRAQVQTLVAIANEPKDDMRRLYLETVRELALLNPGVVVACSGMSCLIQASLNPKLQDISGSLILTLLYLLDAEETRRYVRPALDTCRLFAPFTDISRPINAEKEAQRAAAQRKSTISVSFLTIHPHMHSLSVSLLNLTGHPHICSFLIFSFLFKQKHT